LIQTIERTLTTRGQGDARDVTPEIVRAIDESGLRAGIVTVFVTGSTAGVSTIEYEEGVVTDLAAALERMAPRSAEYRHHVRWGDDNGSGHVRAGLVGPSLVVPFRDGAPLLGTWQQVVLLEFDTRPRSRRLVLQVMGEPGPAPPPDPARG
jgi:secondary thiamine-phosphate synthase enzyme